MELRCENKLHGIVVDDHTIEFKCDSRFCGAGPGITVLHRISTITGETISTETFKDIDKTRKEVQL